MTACYAPLASPDMVYSGAVGILPINASPPSAPAIRPRTALIDPASFYSRLSSKASQIACNGKTCHRTSVRGRPAMSVFDYELHNEGSEDQLGWTECSFKLARRSFVPLRVEVNICSSLDLTVEFTQSSRPAISASCLIILDGGWWWWEMQRDRIRSQHPVRS